MSKMKVANTKDLRKILPELAANSKFRRAIEDVLANTGKPLTIDVAEPWRCFKLTSGKSYKVRIRLAGNTTAYYIRACKVVSMNFSESEVNSHPDKYKNVTPSLSKYIMNGVEFNTVNAKREEVQDATWGQIGRIIGELYRDEFIEIENCSKCGGAGKIEQFMHYADGVCFQCLGIGKWYVLNNKSLAIN